MKTAKTKTVHANLTIIADTGVLITGQANSGKSELSFELLDRGHQLVSDDATELFLKNKQLHGKYPEKIMGLIQINYLGLINVSKVFGENSLCQEHKIDLIIHLTTESNPALTNPLLPLTDSQRLLNVNLPRFTLPSKTKILALQVETLVKNYKLKQAGYDAFTELQQRSAPCKENA